MALAIRYGIVRPTDFEGERPHDPELVRVAKTTEVIADPALRRSTPNASHVTSASIFVTVENYASASTTVAESQRIRHSPRLSLQNFAKMPERNSVPRLLTRLLIGFQT